MDSSFQKVESSFSVHLRNNYDTYLAASKDGGSVTLVSHRGGGFMPRSTKWTVKVCPRTSKFIKFNLLSYYGKELAAKKTADGEIVVHLKTPCSDTPFCWFFPDGQFPLATGVYLSCDCDNRDTVSNFYKICATRDGTITFKPSSFKVKDPGAWWFIEAVEKIASETVAPKTNNSKVVGFTDIEQQKQEQGSLIPRIRYKETISCKWTAPGCSQKFMDGNNPNGSGNQNNGDVKIVKKSSVTKHGYASGSGSVGPALHNQGCQWDGVSADGGNLVNEMVSSFQKRESSFTLNLRNNYDTYLAASDDGRSVTLVSHTGVGSIPKSTEWTVKLCSGTSEFTEFKLLSVRGKELAAQKTDDGEIVVHLKTPCSDTPFCWKFQNCQLPLSNGVYLSCDFDNYAASYSYKLCATQDGTITFKPSFEDTLEDPGAWWFMEEISRIRFRENITYNSSARSCSQKFMVGKNSNGSGNQNIGDVIIENNSSVTEDGYASGSGSFGPALHNQVSNMPSHGTHDTMSLSRSSKAPTMSTTMNVGNNSNGSGTQTNTVNIKNEVPTYRYW